MGLLEREEYVALVSCFLASEPLLTDGLHLYFVEVNIHPETRQLLL
jgi:hypothetical protein